MCDNLKQNIPMVSKNVLIFWTERFSDIFYDYFNNTLHLIIRFYSDTTQNTYFESKNTGIFSVYQKIWKYWGKIYYLFIVSKTSTNSLCF